MPLVSRQATIVWLFHNQLLGADILPEAAVPATGCLTEISFGPEPALEIVSGGHVERAQLDRDVLESFSLYNNPAKDATLRVYWPAEFLRGGITLVDTPGVEDASGDSAEVTYNALQDADAAIVMVSALAPLSLTEQEFIAEYMLDRQVPLLAAAISYYDQLEGDAVKQLEYLAKKCDRLYSSLPLLLPNCPPKSHAGYVCGLDEARKFIVNWSREPGLEKLKLRSAISRMMHILMEEVVSLRGSRELLAGDALEKREQIREALTALEDGAESLADLRIQFVNRAEALQDAVRRDLKTFRQEMAGRAGAPGAEDFAREALTGIYRDLTARIVARLEEDLACLSENMAKSCGSGQLPEISIREMPQIAINAGSRSTNPVLEELLNKGLALADGYARRVPGGAMIWPLLRPMLGQVAENIRSMGSNAQRELEKSLSAACSRISRGLGGDLRDIYARAFEQARAQRREWLMAQKQALAEAAGLDDIKARIEHLDDFLERGMKLHDDMQRVWEEQK